MKIYAKKAASQRIYLVRLFNLNSKNQTAAASATTGSTTAAIEAAFTFKRHACSKGSV